MRSKVRDLARVPALLLVSTSTLAAQGSASDLINLCQSHQTSTDDYVSELEVLGWLEVDGVEGEEVISRAIWVHLPHAKTENIDPTAHYGAICGHQHCGRPTLGRRDWANTAETRAFVQDGSALFVFFRPRHQYPNHKQGELEDYMHCTGIFAPGPLADGANTLMNSARFSSGDAGDVARIASVGWPFDQDLSLPRINYMTNIYKPNQAVVQENDLTHLNYEIGFTTEFKFNFMEPLQ